MTEHTGQVVQQGVRTRGGWEPVGTAAQRREAHPSRGTERGRARRREILAAARRVFERTGYDGTTVRMIVDEAGVARGSFYTYFESKIDAFHALVDESGEEIIATIGSTADEPGSTPRESLRAANRRFVELYQANAALYGLLENSAMSDERTSQYRRMGRRAHIDRVARRIRAWQDDGYADADLDPVATAASLISMTAYQCYWWFVDGEPVPAAGAEPLLSDIWIRTLQLTDEPHASGRPA
ncbi:putative TetR family transcriptional regulator [Gordonia hirsuta DSM 44140 = NBRC 16056]|uniref:Putative TetR family transcriptional regulator n=1 Tax=Gordonia hirsuta DSM 44140 = NBRC 16056 TaxID=1121927 RepID=L7LCD0_9ACTN|nr:TetR/AcrR family transcriptional regulator [Gordonia hirsuta]GAC58396.1 putative TetR family transcriptional regulator [Gordonia hirsuta DSM 44140 = NBRC 16056]